MIGRALRKRITLERRSSITLRRETRSSGWIIGLIIIIVLSAEAGHRGSTKRSRRASSSVDDSNTTIAQGKLKLSTIPIESGIKDENKDRDDYRNEREIRIFMVKDCPFKCTS